MKTALLFAILALSITGFSQNLPSSTFEPHPSSASMNNGHGGLTEPGNITSDIYSEKHLIGTIKHQTPVQFTSQLMDSTYYWQWDILLNEWRLEYKYNNIVYDVNNNLTSELGQLWNGISWEHSNQHINTYDANNNLTSELNQEWRDTAWVNTRQRIYTYDANNNLTSLMFFWNLSGGAYNYSVNYTYDSNNNLTSEFRLYAMSSNNAGFIYTYDAKNNKTSEVYQDWNGSDFVNTSKLIYTYDFNHNKLREVYQEWNGSAWMTTYQYSYTYTYDTNNNKTSELVLFANPFPFMDFHKFNYTYDNNNNLTSEVGQDWKDGVWVNIYRYTFTYDINDNQTSEITGGWLGGAWVNYLQDIYTYDVNNNQTSHIYQQLNGNTWKMIDQWIYTYNFNDFVTSESHKQFDFNSTGTVVMNGDSTHYYFNTITGINDLKADDGSISVYPNPNNGKFIISSNNAISAIEIYNLLGERIYTDHKLNQQSSYDIDLSDQAKGIYIVNIYNGKLIYNRKVVVQ